MTRTDAYKRIVLEMIEERRTEIDRGTIRSMVITAKFSPDSLEPRDIWPTIEGERRKHPREKVS